MVQMDLIDHLVPTLTAMGRDNSHQTRFSKALSNLTLNAARVGASTTSLDKLSQCLTTLI